MGSPLDRVACARVPRASLGRLGRARAQDVRVALDGDHAWVHFRPGGDALRAVLPIAGVELFERRGERWFRPGARVPSSVAPKEPDLPLHRAVAPPPLALEPARDDLPAPVELRLVASDAPRATSAALAPFAALVAWAEVATSAELEATRGARSGERVLLVGRVPALPGAERLWGARVLVPLGARVDPELDEKDLRAALGVKEDELLVLSRAGFEVVDGKALAPLSRAAIRSAKP